MRSIENLATDLEAMIGIITESLKEGLETSFVVGPGGAFDPRPLEVAVKDWEEAVLKAKTDPDLSPSGQRKVIRREGIKLKRAVENWRDGATRAFEEFRQLKAAEILGRIVPAEPKDPIERLRRDLRDHQVLTLLPKEVLQDPLLAEVLYRQSDSETRGALRRAPLRAGVSDSGSVTVGPIVPDEVVREVDDAEAEALDPEGGRVLRDLGRLTGAHEAVVNEITTRLTRAGLDPPDV